MKFFPPETTQLTFSETAQQLDAHVILRSHEEAASGFPTIQITVRVDSRYEAGESIVAVRDRITSLVKDTLRQGIEFA